MTTSRPYTGLKEGYAKGRRPGTELLANGIEWLSGGRLWNNGTYGIRPNHSNVSIPSVHSTGRAIDISHRTTATKKGSDRAAMLSLIDALVKNAELVGLEMLIDYAYTGGYGGGRIWLCDRYAWRDCAKGTINGGGASWADWVHIELDPKHADGPKLIEAAWPALLGTLATPKPKTAKKPAQPA